MVLYICIPCLIINFNLLFHNIISEYSWGININLFILDLISITHERKKYLTNPIAQLSHLLPLSIPPCFVFALAPASTSRFRSFLQHVLSATAPRLHLLHASSLRFFLCFSFSTSFLFLFCFSFTLCFYFCCYFLLIRYYYFLLFLHWGCRSPALASKAKLRCQRQNVLRYFLSVFWSILVVCVLGCFDHRFWSVQTYTWEFSFS